MFIEQRKNVHKSLFMELKPKAGDSRDTVRSEGAESRVGARCVKWM